jgi:hypothetical protein
MANVSDAVDPLGKSERVSNASPDKPAFARAEDVFMRDYRDAKAMAQTLRQSLKAQSIDITHSNALELVAKTLGLKNWQVLSARIEADQATPRLPEQPAPQQSGASVLRCSFCGKTQYEVLKLIAGPDVFICDACVGLCDNIVSSEGLESYPGAQDLLVDRSIEGLTKLEAKANARIAHARQLLELLDAVEGESGPGAGGERSNPRAFIRLKSPDERAAYAAAIKAGLSGLERVAATASNLLAEHR